jgi:hypothetical protein
MSEQADPSTAKVRPDIAAVFANPESAFDLLETIRPTLAEVLRLYDASNASERWPVVSIVEVLYPATGGKLGARRSQVSPKQWDKVVRRAKVDEFVASVTLQPSERYDNRHLAHELPPGMPKSYLKGLAPGPVALTVRKGETQSDVVLDLSWLDASIATMASVVDIGARMIGAALALHDFLLGAIGMDGLNAPPQAFSPGDRETPTVLACGTALGAEARAKLTRGSIDVIDHGAATLIYFDRPFQEQHGDRLELGLG